MLVCAMASQGEKQRLDARLVSDGAFPSRARAQAAIKAGLIRVGGVQLMKPSVHVSPEDEILVEGDVHPYVSRGALKLVAALKTFQFKSEGAVALDLGASTGGFTEVLLKEGASTVYAVDVGTGQLHESLVSDKRVVNLEKTHAKQLDSQIIPAKIGALVCDVSFIGLRKALLPAMALCAPGAWVIALIKPQFEVGPKALGKGGIVPTELADQVAAEMSGELANCPDWREVGMIESPIRGGDGNKEFLIGAIKKK